MLNIKRIKLTLLLLALTGCSQNYVEHEYSIETETTNLKSMHFIKGLVGAENLYAEPNSHNLYATDLQGFIYFITPDEDGKLAIKSSLKIGKTALGIVEGSDGYLYVNASEYSEDGWLSEGGSVYQVSKDLSSTKKLTDLYPGINGLAIDKNNNLYFAQGDLEFFFPDGALYKMDYDNENKTYATPELITDDLGSANGIYYSSHYGEIFFTETFSKVSKLDQGNNKISTLFDATNIIEAFDDLCVDNKGRFWVTEPLGDFVKMYDVTSRSLIRFEIDGLGASSSCAIREESDGEYIYITEREFDDENDGRGIIAIRLDELLAQPQD